jgi:hypothetical protein
MAFTEFETKRYQKILDEFCEEHGPPSHIYRSSVPHVKIGSFSSIY